MLELADRPAADLDGRCAWGDALTFGSAANLASCRDFVAFEEQLRFGYERHGKPVPGSMREPPVHYAGDGAVRRDHPPSHSGRLDYELALGIVLGRTTYEVDPDEVRGHVFGLTLLNDISTRNIQAREMTGGLKPFKAERFACVAGPMRVSALKHVGLASGPDYWDSALICMR